jgi:dihydroneopterin aldolase
VRIEKLDRGPGALGVEIVRDRQAASPVAPEIVQPQVVFLDNAAVHAAGLAARLDALTKADAPVILCVGHGDTARPSAAHPTTQRRIDLLALEQQAWVLAGRDKRCVVVETRTELEWAMKQGQISVWAPSKIVLDAAHKPDLSGIDARTLTAWFAQEFQAADLVELTADGPVPFIA